VTKTNNPGSNRLVRIAADKGAEKTRGVPLLAEQVEQRRRTAQELNLGQYLRQAYREDYWSADEVRLLGTLPDAEVARRMGRSVNGVRLKRQRLGIPNPFDGRHQSTGRR